MQQYLINVSAIWLLSLLLFDLLLRRETYHGYNRFYLLGTLLMGALLPLINWPMTGNTYPSALHAPVEKVLAAKQAIAHSADATISVNYTGIAAILYLAGAATALILLIADCIRTITYYTSGKRHTEGNWHIVETSKAHAPFSFRNILFINTREAYSDNEWQMILAHEARHHFLGHVADLLLLHLARIVFWFLPLVYIYHKRLLMIHEYQADEIATKQVQQYGTFLIEQALLHQAPSITHSFNRSPIKKRLLMLTRTSSVASRSKMLVLLPVLAIAASCFTQNNPVFAQEYKKEGNVVTYNGNKITLTEDFRDTIIVVDPITGKELTQVRILSPRPDKLNGVKIHDQDFVTAMPARRNKMFSLEEQLATNLALKFNTFPDGIYRADAANFVIDDKGKVVYFEFGGLSGTDEKGKKMKLSKEQTEAIQNEIATNCRMVEMTPAVLDGKNVPVLSDLSMQEYKFTVKDHITSYNKTYK